MFSHVCMSIIICGCNFLELQNQFCRIGSPAFAVDYIALIINLTNIWKLWELFNLIWTKRDIWLQVASYLGCSTFTSYYTPRKRIGGRGGVMVSPCPLSVCLSVCLSSVWGRDFVHACSEKWVHGFFWKFVYWLLTIWRCAPGIFILNW